MTGWRIKERRGNTEWTEEIKKRGEEKIGWTRRSGVEEKRTELDFKKLSEEMTRR